MSRGVLCVAVLAVLAGCLGPRPTTPGVPEDTGGTSGSMMPAGGAGGGTIGPGGGGANGSGGVSGAGGAKGSGGASGTGGPSGTGGVSGVGGTPATGSGGASSIGGRAGAAGALGAGGVIGAGGMTGAGGVTGAGGMLAAAALSGTTSKDFASVAVGTASPSFTWTIRNAAGASSTGALTLSNIDSSEVSTTNGCTSPLAGGASCTIAVTFRPSALGARTAALGVSANPGGAVMLSLTANGTVQLAVTTVGTGTVTSVPAGISCPGTCTAAFSTAAVTLQARSTNGSNFFFTGWSDPTCPGPFHDCPKTLTTSSVAITATFSPMNANLIFGTAETYPTNLGGTAPYDKACNSAATAAGLNTSAGNGYIAFFSDQNSNAFIRLGTARGWIRMDGRPFTDTQSGILIDHQLFYPFAFFEDGRPTSHAQFATATNSDGTAAVSSCNNWTNGVNTGDQAAAGLGEGGPWEWNEAVSIICGNPIPLICMGITKNAAVTVPSPGPGRKIWLSGTRFTPGTTTTPDAFCQATLPPGVTTAAALIATTTKTAASLLVPTTSYYRPDGALVGTGADLIAAGQPIVGTLLTSGPWSAVDGTYPPDAAAWTGSATIDALGTTANTCGNWTDSSQTGLVGFAVATLETFWNDSSSPCSTPTRLYCVQTAP